MLTGLHLVDVAMLLVAGVALDLLLGEVRRWHPLVGFGRFVSRLEGWLNLGGHRYLKGILGWVLAVVPLTLAACAAVAAGMHVGLLLGGMLHAALLYFALGLRSLHEHTEPIRSALEQGDLNAARLCTGRIVSRDTRQSDSSALAKAGVESLLENGNDAVFGTLFWFMIAGGPGALLYRLANTLDAMWGYRTPRFYAFGWAAARIDDVLNWIPARLTACSYTLLGNTQRAWRCWRTQARHWPSPNAGPVMAAGAGALGLALGGAASYEGVLELRPPLGEGRAAEAEDIARAWRLVLGTTGLWLVIVALCAMLI
jgi:adenosylcobinamide-phosphate synthase